MHVNLIRHNSIIRLASFALLAFCIIQPPVRAHPAAINTGAAQDSHKDLYRNVWIIPGLARGQTLRYTWANLNDPEPQEQEIEPLRIRVRLLARDRTVIAQTEAAAVGTGQFQSFDFNRDQISLPGEDPTGRLQTLLEATVSGNTKYGDIVLKQGILETFDDAVEIIDNSDGRTTVSFGGGVNELMLNDSPGNEHLNPKTFQIISAGKDYLIGVVPGQTLRFSAFNPIKTESGRHNQPINMQLKLHDAQGNVIAESAEVEIPPGEFRFVDFDHGDLASAGEPGTARNQIRTQALWGLRTSGRFLITTSLEITDNNTGKTAIVQTSSQYQVQH